MRWLCAGQVTGVVKGRTNPVEGSNPYAPTTPVLPLGDMYEGEIGQGSGLSAPTGASPPLWPAIHSPSSGPASCVVCWQGRAIGKLHSASGAQCSGRALSASVCLHCWCPNCLARSATACTAWRALHAGSGFSLYSTAFDFAGGVNDTQCDEGGNCASNLPCDLFVSSGGHVWCSLGGAVGTVGWLASLASPCPPLLPPLVPVPYSMPR